MARNVKKRNWAFVLYPESAPADWREQLQKTGLQCAISPLHDRDINPDNTPKKAHYHVILTYSGPTSYNVVKALTDSLNQPRPQALEQMRGYYRYLTHKDNPEKYQYAEGDIETVNGFNIFDFMELTRSEVTEIKKALQKLIRDNGIMEYSELMDFLQDEEMDAEYEVASNNTYFFDKYITSRRNRLYRRAQTPVQEVGEAAENAVQSNQNTAKSAKNCTKNNQNTTQNNQNTTQNNHHCCPECGSVDIRKNGKTAGQAQKWMCKDCGKSFV